MTSQITTVSAVSAIDAAIAAAQEEIEAINAASRGNEGWYGFDPKGLEKIEALRLKIDALMEERGRHILQPTFVGEEAPMTPLQRRLQQAAEHAANLQPIVDAEEKKGFFARRLGGNK